MVMRRLPRRYFYLLWIPIAFRLLCSFKFTIALIRPSAPVFAKLPLLHLVQSQNTAINCSEHLWEVIALCWFWGILTIWIFIIYKYYRFVRRLRHCQHIEANIYLCPTYPSAFTVGFFHQQIYLPDLKTNTLDYMLQHELMHMKRHDNCWRSLALLITTIHFYNPLIFIAYRCFLNDMEMSCDEEVLKTAKAQDIIGYCQTLISNAQAPTGPISSCFTRNYKEVYHRVKNITQKKYPSLLRLILMTLTIVAIAFFFINFTYLNQTFNAQTTKASPEITNETVDASSDDLSKDISFYAPLENFEITCGYYCYSYHLAEDITDPTNEHAAVYAAQSGTVIAAQTDSKLGNYVIIAHDDDFYSLYGNLGTFNVSQDEKVSSQQQIGELGISGLSTGPHVHFAIRQIFNTNQEDILDHFNNEYPDDIIYKIEDINSK